MTGITPVRPETDPFAFFSSEEECETDESPKKTLKRLRPLCNNESGNDLSVGNETRPEKIRRSAAAADISFAQSVKSKNASEESKKSTEGTENKKRKSLPKFSPRAKLLRRTPVEENKDFVQELSIQQLSLSRTAKWIKASGEEIRSWPLASIIAKVVEVYNKSKEAEKKTTKDAPPKSKYESFPYKFTARKNFNLSVFKHTQAQKTSLTRELEKGSTSKLSINQGTDFILFFYRDKPIREIFAATSGNAWQVLNKCRNYDYPVNAVKRILNPAGIIEITRRCLVGSVVKETLTNPAGYELYKTMALYYLFESFRCEVKKNSSLLGLKGFSDYPPVIKIASGLLRVEKRIPLTSYPDLLHLFSRYIQGEKTFTLKENQEEVPDSLFEFLNFLQPAYGKKRELDAQLMRKIFLSHQAGVEQTTFFRHKFLNDFLYATSYSIQFVPRQKYYLLERRPSNLEEVLDLLEETAFKSPETLLEVFKTVSFKYNKGSVESQPDKLIDYLEGEIRSTEGSTYFKIRGMWYKLATDCHALLQDDFRNLLSKILIDPKKGKGQLPRAWHGNSRKGKLTEAVVKKELDITKGIKAFMKSLATERVCYVENSTIRQRKLVGEILNKPLIRKHQRAIEEHVLALDLIPPPEELAKLFGKEANKVLKELRKKRSIIKNGYVLNPFLKRKSKDARLLPLLEEYCQAASNNREDEAVYNSSYCYDQRNNGVCFGPETGYLVLDQICPFNVEPCDIVYYTPATSYLYHVKEELGQDTRDACSQILNAAKEFRSALSVNQGHDYLQELWRVGSTTPKKKIAKQLEHLGQRDFLNIFYKRKIVFVYAFLGKATQSLIDEVSLPSRISPDDFKSFEPSLEKEKVHAVLVDQGFLDQQGRLTGKFYTSSKKRFNLEGFKGDSEAVYTHLRKYKSKSESSLAKLELLHLAEEIQSLGFTLKICQIERAEIGTDSSQLTHDSILEDTFEIFEENTFANDSTELSQKQRVGLSGFNNIYNSCYMNAVLQMLFAIPEICDKIESEVKKQQPNTSLLPSLHKLMQLNDACDSKPLLKQFRNQIFALDQEKKKLPGGKKGQHDAHEFLELLVENLEWNTMVLCERLEVNHPKLLVPEISEQSFVSEFHFSMPLTSPDFQGIINDYFMEKNIVVEDKQVEPLKRQIAGRQVLIKEWKSTTCIIEWPNYFIIHLKRFTFNQERIITERSNQHVLFPSNEEVSVQGNLYEIIAYVNHKGNAANEGHYTADIKKGNVWINCDDRHVEEKPPENPGKEAYLVLLRKK